MRYPAVAAVALVWLQRTNPAGYRIEQYLVLAAVTVLIGGIGARTLVALYRRQLLRGAVAT
jgi:tellurite resistance protein